MIFIVHTVTFNHSLCYTAKTPLQNKGQVLQNYKILVFLYSSFTQVYILPQGKEGQHTFAHVHPQRSPRDRIIHE